MEQNMDAGKNKNMWIGVGVVAVIIVIVIAMMMNKNDTMPADENTGALNQEAVTTNDDTTAESTEDVSEGSVNTGAPAATVSYQDALVKYKDRRLQFNNMCQASAPNSVTYKDNTGIMLDNRSAQTRTIKVGQTYTIKPYGFKIVVLPDIYLKAKTIYVDCDTQQNVATVLVQE